MLTLGGPRHFPFPVSHLMRRPGLTPLDPADWIDRDPAYVSQMELRDRLIDQRRAACVAELPSARPAVDELETMLAAHLLATDPEYRAADGGIARPGGAVVPLGEGLVTIGRLVQEDFLLLAPGGAGEEHVLVAGVLCFPAWWALADKIGRPLTAIHGPVPEYDDGLARRVNRVFDALRPETPLMRVNWSVAPGEELHTPPGKGREPGPAGSCLRIERQTLRRLPDSGAVAFSVKTELTPIAALEPEQATAVLWALDELSAEMRGYKLSAAEFGTVRTALGRAAGQSPGNPR